MPEVLRWIQGWSTKKKVLWGIVAGFLFLVCVSALVAEPVEETSGTTTTSNLASMPLLKAARLSAEDKGFEYYDTSEGGIFGKMEIWEHPSGGKLHLIEHEDSKGDYKEVRLSYSTLNNELTKEQIDEMRTVVEFAVPKWTEGKSWVSENVRDTLKVPLGERLSAGAQVKRFTSKYHRDMIPGFADEVEVGLDKNRFYINPEGITLRVRIYE